MTNNYFAIERMGRYIDHIFVKREDNTIVFEDVMNMSYEEIKAYKDIDTFVTAFMDATNKYFNESDETTIVTLVGSDDVFIWSVLIGPGTGSDKLTYVFIDWKKYGKSYRYEKK